MSRPRKDARWLIRGLVVNADGQRQFDAPGRRRSSGSMIGRRNSPVETARQAAPASGRSRAKQAHGRAQQAHGCAQQAHGCAQRLGPRGSHSGPEATRDHATAVEVAPVVPRAQASEAPVGRHIAPAGANFRCPAGSDHGMPRPEQRPSEPSGAGERWEPRPRSPAITTGTTATRTRTRAWSIPVFRRFRSRMRLREQWPGEPSIGSPPGRFSCAPFGGCPSGTAIRTSAAEHEPRTEEPHHRPAEGAARPGLCGRSPADGAPAETAIGTSGSGSPWALAAPSSLGNIRRSRARTGAHSPFLLFARNTTPPMPAQQRRRALDCDTASLCAYSP